MYLVPNVVTTGNMFCGFLSIILSIQFDFIMASWAVLAASVFDLLDGRIARLAKATSPFGTEYDSLCDLISFGLAPAVLIYLWALEPYGRLGWICAFIFTACGALRLARFNVTTETIGKGFFQGLPIPAGAATLVTFVIFVESAGIMNWFIVQIVAFCLLVGVGLLMVSSVPFPSFKELNWRSRGSFGVLGAGIAGFILIAVMPEIALFTLVLGYILVSLGMSIGRILFPQSKRSQAKVT